MKKNIAMKILMVILMVSFLTGCARTASEKVDVTTSNPRDNGSIHTSDLEVNKGITVNQIKFEVVDTGTLSDQLQVEIDALKFLRGYAYWRQEDGSYIIFIGAGEKPTGGYNIEANSIEDNEGKTIILVTESGPSKDEMVYQSVTYPFIVLQASGITDRFEIYDQDNNEYSVIEGLGGTFLPMEGEPPVQSD